MAGRREAEGPSEQHSLGWAQGFGPPSGSGGASRAPSRRVLVRGSPDGRPPPKGSLDLRPAPRAGDRPLPACRSVGDPSEGPGLRVGARRELGSGRIRGRAVGRPHAVARGQRDHGPRSPRRSLRVGPSIPRGCARSGSEQPTRNAQRSNETPALGLPGAGRERAPQGRERGLPHPRSAGFGLPAVPPLEGGAGQGAGRCLAQPVPRSEPLPGADRAQTCRPGPGRSAAPVVRASAPHPSWPGGQGLDRRRAGPGPPPPPLNAGRPRT
jgi:hypothetical protein